jgi:hypothetical protein
MTQLESAGATKEANSEAKEIVEAEDESMETKWKKGDRVCAVWAGNGCYYSATCEEVNPEDRTMRVEWDDHDKSHLVIPFDQVQEPNADTRAWTGEKIDKHTIVRDSADKGRCLYTKEGAEPGSVVFIEKPILVALPASNQPLWDHLQKLHETQPLNLGTVTFHYAALLSELDLEEENINIVMDKFVPEPDEDAGEDVIRILKSVTENIPEVLKGRNLDPRRMQRLVSAWRYNSFGHHKEDGLVLYNRISMCSHSCDPSCCWSYGDEDAFVLRARVGLKPGAELTISYLQDEDLLKSTAVRQQKLQNWKFTCMCERCSLKIDEGRGFRCRRCRIGVHYYQTEEGLLPCGVCNSTISKEDQSMLFRLETEYVLRVDTLDKTDVNDVELVYQAAIDIFERHWILYVMDTMLWEAYREKRLHDAMEHQRKRIEFHEHFYCRPTFILAWCHEELGDSLQVQFPHRKWQLMQEFQRAYQMLAILCGTNHQYTASPYNKLWQASTAGSNGNSAGNAVADAVANTPGA